MRSAVKLVVCATIFAVAAAGHSVTPRSSHYAMEYVATGMGGGISSSSSYSLVAYTDDTGSAGMASSSSYSLEPAVGASEDTPKSSVSHWTLY